MCEYTVCDISHISLQYILRLDQSHLGTISVLSEAVRLTDNGFQPLKNIQRSSKISRTMRQLLITDTNFRFDPLLEDYPTE